MRQADPHELDISPLDAIDRYPAILRCFDRLAVGERLWIATDREPGLFRRRLRLDRAGAFEWTFDRHHEHLWIVVITKVRETPGAAADDLVGYWARMTHPAVDRPPTAQEWEQARRRPCPHSPFRRGPRD